MQKLWCYLIILQKYVTRQNNRMRETYVVVVEFKNRSIKNLNESQTRPNDTTDSSSDDELDVKQTANIYSILMQPYTLVANQ